MKTNMPFVPFPRSKEDIEHLNSFYADAPLCRLSMENPNRISTLQPSYQLWIDLALDGAQDSIPDSDYHQYLQKHGDITSLLTNDSFLESPQHGQLSPIILSWLRDANALNPFAISIPQLPHVDRVKNNKINKLLFSITVEWCKTLTAPPKMILPVILTNQRQLNKKTDRNPKVNFIKGLLTKNPVDGLWITDKSIEDQLGTANFDKERFPGIIEFFREIKAASEVNTIIAGPFWGLGLVLWARGLATHFAIGLGSAYKYYLPGGITRAPKSRVMIPPLRRWTSSTRGLEEWLGKALTILPSGTPEYAELEKLKKGFPAFLSQATAKRQIAREYRNWVNKFINIPPAGRSVALFQDLSGAFVTGKTLPDLPDETGPARRPERVAEQLMLNCL